MSRDQNKDELKYILNEKNKYITREYIQSTLSKFNINIKIVRLEIFQLAMVHLSYLIRNEKFYKNNKTKPYQIQSNDIEPLDNISEAIPLQEESYERLEFLGDAIIHAIIAEYLFNRYDNEDEGFMTKLRTKIENGDTLSVLSRHIGLNEYVIISRYVEKSGGRETNKSLLEDAFEAFTGALYLEAGFDICKKFIVTLIEQQIDLAQMLHQETNFKERLLQYFHIRKWLDPIYGVLDISGPDNKKMYTMFVKCKKHHQDPGDIVGIGVGTSKKSGEQDAAKKSLIQYNQYNEDDDSDCDTVEELTDSDEDYESDKGNSNDDEYVSESDGE
jgi:dsRNA-specific ribonuclease